MDLNSIYFKIGAPVSVPSAGVKGVFVDTDGSLKLIDSTGTKSASGGFGSDTLVQLPNSNNAQVTSLELITTLLVATAGSESSNWVLKVLNGSGAQATALDIRSAQTLFPNGAAANPAVSFQNSTNSGLYLIAGTAVSAVFNGTQTFFWDNGGIHTFSGLPIFLNSDSARGMKTPDLANICLFTDGDVQLGDDNAIATNATVGFVDYPSCAGTPTGVPSHMRTGKVSTVIDTTAGKFWARLGGTWKSLTFA